MKTDLGGAARSYKEEQPRKSRTTSNSDFETYRRGQGAQNAEFGYYGEYAIQGRSSIFGGFLTRVEHDARYQ